MRMFSIFFLAVLFTLPSFAQDKPKTPEEHPELTRIAEDLAKGLQQVKSNTEEVAALNKEIDSAVAELAKVRKEMADQVIIDRYLQQKAKTEIALDKPSRPETNKATDWLYTLAKPIFWDNHATPDNDNQELLVSAFGENIPDQVPRTQFWRESENCLMYQRFSSGSIVLTAAKSNELIIFYQKGTTFGALMGEQHFQSDYVTAQVKAALAHAAEHFAEG